MKKKVKNNQFLGFPEDNLKYVMQKIDRNSQQFLAIVNKENQLLGTVTDGDIRRALLNGMTLDEPILKVMNQNPKVISSASTLKERQQRLHQLRLKQVPVVDEQNRVVDIWFADDKETKKHTNKVVLMAGGLGTRLRPLTEHTPKPMLPIGGKPILELIIEHFKKHGFYDFIISVNYKKETIQNYFQDGSAFDVSIEYIEEQKRLGTAGALSLIKQSIKEPFFVMNGDILTNFNCEAMLQQHLEQEAFATMAVREYEYQIPYGVVETEGTRLVNISEKPTHSYFVNAGIYILSPELLSKIPVDTFYDMPTLFSNIKRDEVAQVYPIQEYWLDIGHLDEYESVREKPLKEIIQ